MQINRWRVTKAAAYTHVLVARELAIVKHWRLPPWKNEGYAGLIAKGPNFDYAQARAQLAIGDPDLDSTRSGLYRRYHLLVAYLLDQRGSASTRCSAVSSTLRGSRQKILAVPQGEGPWHVTKKLVNRTRGPLEWSL